MEDMKLQDLSVVMEFNGDRLSNLRRREVLRVLILGAKANEAGPWGGIFVGLHFTPGENYIFWRGQSIEWRWSESEYEEGLIYCSSEIPKEDYIILPGTSGYEFLVGELKDRSNLQKTQVMVQNALIYPVDRLRKRDIEPSVCYIREGPYAIPVFREYTP